MCESAIFVINGVMGVEVSTRRLWERAEELGVARLIYVNMLDRERADFFRTLDSLKEAFGPHVVATEIPIGSEHEIRGVIDLVDMKALRVRATASAREIPIPDELAEQAQEYREKLMDEVAENSEALMERYLEGEEISHDGDRHRARGRHRPRPHLPGHLRRGHHAAWPPTGCSTRSSTTSRRPVQHGGASSVDGHIARARPEARRCSPTCSRPAPTRSPAASTSSASTRAR